MSLSGRLSVFVLGWSLLAPASPVFAQALSESFDVVVPPGWTAINNSVPMGTTTVFQGNPVVFPAQSGAPNSYAGMNFNATTGNNTISVWLITPVRTPLQNGTVSFFTRTVAGSIFPDRLQFYVSTNGSCNPGTGPTSVGDFATLLVDINPTLALGGYPVAWTQFLLTVSGVPGGASGCFAFRYFVTNGGPDGSHSNYIGIDTFDYGVVPVELMGFSVE